MPNVKQRDINEAWEAGNEDYARSLEETLANTYLPHVDKFRDGEITCADFLSKLILLSHGIPAA